jgi:hypothetical protein
MNKQFTARQGDIWIEQIAKLPKKLKLRKTKIILYGEATNHSHRLVDGSVFDGKDGIFLKVLRATQIIHDEHKPIDLPKGFYSVKRQVEYLAKDMVRLVID